MTHWGAHHPPDAAVLDDSERPLEHDLRSTRPRHRAARSRRRGCAGPIDLARLLRTHGHGRRPAGPGAVRGARRAGRLRRGVDPRAVGRRDMTTMPMATSCASTIRSAAFRRASTTRAAFALGGRTPRQVRGPTPATRSTRSPPGPTPKASRSASVATCSAGCCRGPSRKARVGSTGVARRRRVISGACHRRRAPAMASRIPTMPAAACRSAPSLPTRRTSTTTPTTKPANSKR